MGIVQWLKNNKAMFLILIVVVVSFLFLINVLFTIQLKYEKTALQEDIFELENRLLSAQQELEKTKTDIYIHQEATERLGLTKSDETPVKINIVNDKDDETAEEDVKKMNSKKLKVFLESWYESIAEQFKR